MAQIISNNEEIKYSKRLSALFCSLAIIALSILSLLNNQTLDIYSALSLIKVVVPGAFCYWFAGYVIGRIFDGYTKKVVRQKKYNEKKAYEIPSMFSSGASPNTNTDTEININESIF